MPRFEANKAGAPPAPMNTCEDQPKRVFSGFSAMVVTCIAIALSLFHVYTAAFGAFDAVRQRSVHLAGVLVLAFLLFPAIRNKAGDKRVLALDVFLALCSVFVGAYAFLFYNKIAITMASLSALDITVGLMTVVLVLEACRRVVGLPLTIVGMVFLAYAFFGRYAPEIIAFRGANLYQVAYQMFFTTEGIFSTPLGISATYVALFVLFGAFLKISGAGDVMIRLAYALVGHVRGGAAKIAIVASSLMGTVSGSSVANVVTTGSFTIPLMKSIGYQPQFAAAVEAVASTGGQIMPPIMGAAAFIIAETLGISYWTVVKAAVVPAILYFLSVFIMVDIQAVKRGIKGVPRQQLPSLRDVLRDSWLLVIPIGTLIYTIGVVMMSPMKSAFLAIISLFVVSLFKRDGRINAKKVAAALKEGAMGMVSCAIACAGAGVIIGVITLSGLGLRLSSIMIELAGGSLPILMVLTMVASIILGMGVPATAAYILTAVLIAPAMVNMGAVPLAAHLFVFYFAIVSMITPPVAVAAYAAAGIAGSDQMRTGYTAMWLGLSGFIIPFIFITRPGILFMGAPFQIFWAILSAVLAIALLSVALQGYFFDLGRMGYIGRAIALAAGLLLVIPGVLADIVGFGTMATLAGYYLLRARVSRGKMLQGTASVGDVESTS